VCAFASYTRTPSERRKRQAAGGLEMEEMESGNRYFGSCYVPFAPGGFVYLGSSGHAWSALDKTRQPVHFSTRRSQTERGNINADQDAHVSGSGGGFGVKGGQEQAVAPTIILSETGLLGEWIVGADELRESVSCSIASVAPSFLTGLPRLEANTASGRHTTMNTEAGVKSLQMDLGREGVLLSTLGKSVYSYHFTGYRT